METIYKDRFLSEGYPNLEAMVVEHKRKRLKQKNLKKVNTRILNNIHRIERLVDLSEGLKTVAVVGCGPNPLDMKLLLKLGYDVIGVEPLARSVSAAAEFLGDSRVIIKGSAESLQLPDLSQRIIIMNQVLEHVDSPIISLAECFRVLTPDGVLYVSTTNKYHFSISGHNWEFRRRFYNWYPAVVKECYVFQHLHYNPKLANFSPRPAVHWYSYSELCKLGRNVGFAKFYSLFDLSEVNDPWIKNSLIRRRLLGFVKSNACLKAIALFQVSTIYMYKRKTAW